MKFQLERATIRWRVAKNIIALLHSGKTSSKHYASNRRALLARLIRGWIELYEKPIISINNYSHEVQLLSPVVGVVLVVIVAVFAALNFAPFLPMYDWYCTISLQMICIG